ncbi:MULTISPECIES: pilus assembly protein PilP [Aeromonas]|jgi:type IV pilus assembly protein PilP|uniref:Pilus assembly protein PilP n=1 Tax=Aeromonas sobria TaxID=646 RepID=A0A2N3IMA2_AERSO|nr:MULTISPECIES: pilus assembly protein PilP [Aeromonas]ATL93469.1 pilus assembly protein PilP [Aeromonas sp. CU5]ELM3617999.1 pilus assembly protein PilP [Aeromonas sobria]MCX7127941.1 pilus assembly protein PilP [Aeromonas sp.]PKQ71575.1 pilus assembly protein PilP [Aeromonas sobria]PKQ73550.1 pilus assembly protein PilP [Aeromonas sobria]
MKRSCWLLPALLLAACGGQEDMDAYVAQVKARPPIPIEPLPELKPFSPMSYQQRELRSPFMMPQPEASVGSDSTAKLKPDCAQTVMEREKEVLESYSLASLSMQGSLGKKGQLWALVRTPDGQSMRVGLNQYMGLDQGRVIKITDTAVDLLETIPDGKGCWVTRETQLAMANVQEKQ